MMIVAFDCLLLYLHVLITVLILTDQGHVVSESRLINGLHVCVRRHFSSDLDFDR